MSVLIPHDERLPVLVHAVVPQQLDDVRGPGVHIPKGHPLSGDTMCLLISSNHKALKKKFVSCNMPKKIRFAQKIVKNSENTVFRVFLFKQKEEKV